MATVLGEYFTIGSGTVGFIISTVIATFVLFNFILVLQAFLPWVERKVMARMMNRKGPTYAGPFGILQNIADTIKLISKQDIIPEDADRIAFEVGMFLLVWSTIVALAPVHLSDSFVITRLEIGVLFVFGVFSLFAPASLIFGWGTNSKYSMLGGFRSAAQVIAYEIPFALSVVGVFVYTESFQISTIVASQNMGFGGSILGWFGFPQMLGLFVFFICAVAETERIPFDIPEAEAELVMGLRTEMSAWRYAVILMVEYLHLFINSALVIYLFLGGWHDPFPESWIEGRFSDDSLLLQIYFAFWFLLKDFILLLIVTWMRVALPRMRIDQFLSFGWLTLLPLSIANIIIATILIFTGHHDTFVGIIVGLSAMIFTPIILAVTLGFRKRSRL